MSRTGLVLSAVVLTGFLAFIAWQTFREPDPAALRPGNERRGGVRERRLRPPALPPRPAAAREPEDVPAEPAPPPGDVRVLISGVVLGPDGEPAPGADVYTASSEELSVFRPEGARRVRTDAVGAFRLELAPGVVDLLAWRPGTLPAIVKDLEVTVARPPAPVVLRLEAGVELVGVVVDTEGEPVVAAAVVAYADESLASAALLPARAGIPRWGGRATSGEDGRFAIGGLRAEPLFVRARRIGIRMTGEPPEVVPGTTTVRLVVRRLRVATARIVDEDTTAPVAGATVALEVSGPTFGEILKTVTAEDGRFALDLSSNRYAREGLVFHLLVSAKGFEDGQVRDLAIADLAPEAALDVPLIPAVATEPGRLKGRVMYDTGAPYTGSFTLSFSREGSAGEIRRVFVDENGDFLLEDIPAGEYVLRTAPGASLILRETGQRLVVPPGGEETAEFTFERGGDVELRFGGSPPAGIRVHVLDEAGQPLYSVGAAGSSIRLSDLETGAAKFRIEAPGYAAEIVEANVEKDAVTPVDVNLRKDR